MRILDGYIARSVIGATFLVVLVLLGVESFIEFIGELGDIGQKHYHLWDAFYYVPMTLPSDLYQFFPMAGLLGSLLGLGRLAQSNQLVVMRSAGLSKARITGAVIQAAIVMLVFVTLVGEFMAPSLLHLADQLKAKALGQSTGVERLSNVWLRQGHAFVFVSRVIDHDHIQGIVQYVFDDQHRLQTVIKAKAAYLSQGQWVLKEPAKTMLKSRRVMTARPQTLSLNFSFNPRLIEISRQSSAEVSIVQLWHNIRYRQEFGLAAGQYEYAFWQRLFQPLTTIVMIALGVPFIFGSLRDTTMGFRMLLGILIGFGFYMLNQFFGPFSMVYQLPPLLAALLPTLFFALTGWWLMVRAR